MAQCTHKLHVIAMLFCVSQVVTYAKLHKTLHLLTSLERHTGVQPTDTWPVIVFGLLYVDLDAYMGF